MYPAMRRVSVPASNESAQHSLLLLVDSHCASNELSLSGSGPHERGTQRRAGCRDKGTNVLRERSAASTPLSRFCSTQPAWPAGRMYRPAVHSSEELDGATRCMGKVTAAFDR